MTATTVDVLHDRDDVVGVSAAVVHDEVGVYVGDNCPANAVSLEATGLDHDGSGARAGVPEDRAAAGPSHGLGLAAAPKAVLNVAGDGVVAAGRKPEGGLEHDLGGGERRRAVAPLDLGGGVAHQPLAGAQAHHVLDDRAHPLVAGARVHRDGPAHGARNARAELESGKRAPHGLRDELRERERRPRRHAAVLCKAHARELAAKRDDAAVIARVGHEDVRALPHDHPGHALGAQDLDGLEQGLIGVRAHEERGGATDAVRRAMGEPLAADHVRVDGPREAHVCVEDAHARYSSFFSSRSRMAAMNAGPIWVTSPAPWVMRRSPGRQVSQRFWTSSWRLGT